MENIPSRIDGPFPWFHRLISVASRRGALLAALTLSAACDEDVIVAHDPLAQGDAGTPPTGPHAAGDAGREPEPQPVGIARLPDVASGGSPESNVLALGVLERLEDLCGYCHTDGDNGAGFSGGIDLAQLIETGMIVPGSSAASPLLGRIADGSMPPETPVGQTRRERAPTVGDIALLADFIDQLSTEPAPHCEPLPFVGLDAVYASLLVDVQSLPAEDRAHARYVTLADASNARLCGPALEQQRQALFKLINSLSMQSQIHLPTAIGSNGLLYRIDLRNYGWAREIDVESDGVVDFADGWAAALGAVSHSVAFDGPEAGVLSAETGASVPLSSLSALTRAAADGGVYRALLGVPANLYDMEVELGVDVFADFEALSIRRAGFFRYPPRSEVMVSRLPLGELDDRAYWVLAMDDSGQIRGGSIYDETLDYRVRSWSKAIVELPNGLLGYLVNDPVGAPLASFPRGCIDSCVRSEWPAPVTCMACHAHGLQPVKDVLRAGVIDDEPFFDRETFAATLAIFPPAAELDQIIANDNARYGAALARLGIQPGTPDPISRVYLDYDRPLDLERAAAELGVPTQTLTDHLGALPALAPLGDPSGTVERSVFDAAYLEALCAVHATSRNRPTTCP